MLLGDFFEISDINNAENGSIEALIKINKDHAIFNGHFPEFPIVPGVCMIQMVKEIVCSLQKSSMMLIGEIISNSYSLLIQIFLKLLT